MSGERRSYDASISEIKQEVRDLKELILLRETACQQSIMLKLQDHQADINDLKKAWRAVEKPVKVIGWTVIIFVSGVLAIFGSKSGHYIWKKFFE